ncbi:MAG: amino acid ABC transporter permease [Smithellaceae bacterium]|nr:amino acid ABC transporter permease [Smithellaceae bacterium]
MEAFLKDLIAYGPQILAGLKNTLWLMVIMSVAGLAGGIGVFYLSVCRQEWVRKWTEAYISFFIGTPLIVHLFLMYYGLPQFGIRLSAFTVAVIGFTLNVSAYNARFLAAAYNGLDRSELEAARSQGFSHPETFRLIILPQVLRLSVPSLTNQVIQNLKDTSVAFLIQFPDLFAQMQEVASMNFQFFKAYVTAGLIYLVLALIIVAAARRLEKKVSLPGLAT